MPVFVWGYATVNTVVREDLIDKMHLSRELKGMNKHTMQDIVSRIFQAKETAGAKEAGMCLVCSGNSIKVSVPGGERVMEGK